MHVEKYRDETRSKKESKVGIKGASESAEAFIKVWKAAEQGKVPRKSVERIYFADVDTLTRTLNNRRLVLLQALRSHGACSIKSLSQSVERDYKNVYGDVQLLKHVGLIENDDQGLISVPWDRIRAKISLAG